MDREIEYVTRREAEERRAAAAATSDAVRDAHLVMAERYADQAYSLDQRFFDDE